MYRYILPLFLLFVLKKFQFIKNSLRSFRQRYILAHATDTYVAQNIIFYFDKVLMLLIFIGYTPFFHNIISYENDSSRRLFFATLK